METAIIHFVVSAVGNLTGKRNLLGDSCLRGLLSVGLIRNCIGRRNFIIVFILVLNMQIKFSVRLTVSGGFSSGKI